MNLKELGNFYGLIIHKKSRYCSRIIPFSLICNANMDDIKKNAKQLFTEAFSNDETVLLVAIV